MKKKIIRIIPAITLAAMLSATAICANEADIDKDTSIQLTPPDEENDLPIEEDILYTGDGISDDEIIEFEPISIKEIIEDEAIILNGETLDGANTRLFEDHLYVPVRPVSEALNYEIEWIAESKSIILANLPQYITFNALTDGYSFARTAPIELGYAPVLTEGKTYVPIEFLTSIMNLDIEITDNNAVIISTEKSDLVEEEVVEETEEATEASTETVEDNTDELTTEEVEENTEELSVEETEESTEELTTDTEEA